MAILVLGLQHAGLAIMFMIYPVVVAREIGLTSLETSGLITGSLIAAGVATMLQARAAPLGSGSLAVEIPGPLVLPAMIHASSLGGLGAVAAMLTVHGLAEATLARMLHRLRQLFPPEVCGVAVLMLGISIAQPALVRFTGVNLDQAGALALDPAYLLVGTATLAAIVGFAVFGRGGLKLFALVFGLLTGALLSLVMGLIEPSVWHALRDAPVAGLPTLLFPAWQVEVLLIPHFVLIAIVTTVDNLGVLVSIQRLNDPNWVRADLRSAAGGVQASSIGNLIAGTVGGTAVGISSSNVGLAFATGTSARIVGFVAGGLMIGAVFLPKAIVALASIPAPVIGAIMIYTAAYMIVSGMDLILSRMLSERRIFTVGLSIVFGLTVVIFPDIYEGLPEWLVPLFQSELALATLSAILLNLLFRIGIAQRASQPVPPDSDAYDFSQEFLKRQGDLWGARREIVQRAVQASSEALETLRSQEMFKAPPEMTASFNEFDLDVTLTWHGKPLATPDERPSLDDILEDESNVSLMAGFLIRRYADQVTHRSHGQQQRLTLHFQH